MDIFAPPSLAPCDIPSFHGHIRTAFPGSLRYTTTTDGGSADIAGANICPSFPGAVAHGCAVYEPKDGHKKSNDLTLLYLTELS